MKQLTCEMCGGTDLIKQDGVFVCQSCGMKYSVEEAKKMMIEGTVDVSGSTIKVDQSGELKNLYELARRAKNDNNSENAQKYYEQILIKDPSSWEANFYAVYYQSMNCKIGQIQSAAIKLRNCVDTVLQLIKDNIPDPQEQRKALDEMGTRLISISQLFFDAARSHYNGIDCSIRQNYARELFNNLYAAMGICYNFGNHVIEIFGDEYGKDIAVSCWKTGITQNNDAIIYFMLYGENKDIIEANKNEIMNCISKVQKYDPSYTPPQIYGTKTPSGGSSGGCYVATAVYGSYDCPQVWTLRRYRDYTLAETWYGRAFIHTYYAISPTLVKWFGDTEWFKRMWKGKLDRMVANLKAEGVKDTPYEDRSW